MTKMSTLSFINLKAVDVEIEAEGLYDHGSPFP